MRHTLRVSVLHAVSFTLLVLGTLSIVSCLDVRSSSSSSSSTSQSSSGWGYRSRNLDRGANLSDLASSSSSASVVRVARTSSSQTTTVPSVGSSSQTIAASSNQPQYANPVYPYYNHGNNNSKPSPSIQVPRNK